MPEKEDSLLELPMPILVKAMDHFLRMKKKMGPIIYLGMEKQNALLIMEEKVPTPALKKVPAQKGKRKGVKIPSLTVTTKDQKGKAKSIFPYKISSKSEAPLSAVA